MTPEDVKALVVAIHTDNMSPSRFWDDEGAHVDEDHLYRALLEAIASGNCSDPVACAREALQTQQYDFSRWCA